MVFFKDSTLAISTWTPLAGSPAFGSSSASPAYFFTGWCAWCATRGTASPRRPRRQTIAAACSAGSTKLPDLDLVGLISHGMTDREICDTPYELFAAVFRRVADRETFVVHVRAIDPDNWTREQWEVVTLKPHLEDDPR